MLEGGRLIGPTLTNTYECKYIPDCPDMDEEVQALHDLARNGVISADTAERQINMYLLVASHRKVAHGLPPERLRWLLLPITDVPCVGLLPDLGQLIHRILTRDPLQCAISRIMEQCIPSMRHVSRAAYTYQDSHDILLTLVQALLFGTFPNVSKKPGFVTRVALWRRMHYLLTASRQEQTAFLEGHQDMLYLASMEYIARVVPVYMPAQDAFLTGRDAVSAPFFRRIPPLCDEFRQLVDDAIQDESASHTPMTWARMQELCAGYVERVSRLKRSHASSSSGTHTGGGGGGKDAVRDPIPRGPLPNIIDYWSVPQLHGNPSRDEFRLLGLSLGLNGSVIMQIQRDLQISLLPENLRRLQIQRLLAHSGGEMRTLFLRTRRCESALAAVSVCLSVCLPYLLLRLIRTRFFPGVGWVQVHLHALHADEQDAPHAPPETGHTGPEPGVRRVHEVGPDADQPPGAGPALQAAPLLPLPCLHLDPAVHGARRATVALVPPSRGGRGALDMPAHAGDTARGIQPEATALLHLHRGRRGAEHRARGSSDRRGAQLPLLPATHAARGHPAPMRQRQADGSVRPRVPAGMPAVWHDPSPPRVKSSPRPP